MRYFCIAILLLWNGLLVSGEEMSRGMVLEEMGNEKPSFFVRVSVNHENLEYQEGDLLQVQVRASESGYLYLFYQDASNQVSLLYPNQYDSEHYISKNTDIQIPSPGQNFRIRTAAPFGEERLLAVVTKKPLQTARSIQLSRNVTSLSAKDVSRFSKELLSKTGETTLSSEEWAEQLLRIRTFPASAPSPSPSPTPSRKTNRFLICIGVSHYEDEKIPPLPPCTKDVKNLARYFLSQGLPENHIVVLLDEQVTMANIRALFCEELPQITKPGDEVILFWTGHGNQCADENGDEKDGKDETLVLYDSRRLEPETQLLDDTFGRWIQNLDGRKILVILDACHSAGLASSKSFFNSRSTPVWDFGFNEISSMKDLGQRNLAIIASSTSSQPSLLRVENDMSVMTYFLLQALNERQGWTHDALFQKIRPQVKEYVKENYYGAQQDMELQDDMESPMQLN
ncbi:MAG: caspase family protein [Planctomycetia bacterium]|nr:caspase family protein [Planctomycetia bacterium]